MPLRFLFLLALLLPTLANAQPVVPGLRVPEGFEVVEYADAALANDIYTMTIDPRGRIVVAGRDYIRLLLDKNNDGMADAAVPLAAPKDGAMGLLWEGDYLYYTGDGGLRRLHIKDDKPVGAAELLCKLKTGGEHDAHAIRRGPDGWLYVLCGNNAQVDKLVQPASSSPIQKPIAGCVLRLSPDFKTREIVAHGFRNPYDMDFDPSGELFTFDSDNERCVSLPWYEPMRFYHVWWGGHHGWLSPQHASFWRMPPYFLDVVPPACSLTRGSPTGCVCYRHGQFPEKYRGGFFLCDWTFGQIHHVKLYRHDSEYLGESKVFLRATGENGFAPTAAAVHPETGDLFVSIGGRGTRGAVYRIRYPKGLAGAKERASAYGFPKTSYKPVHEFPDKGLRDYDSRYMRHIIIQRMARYSAAEAARQFLPLDSRQRITFAFGRLNTAPGNALREGLTLLRDKECNPAVKLDVTRLLQLALGDIGAKAHLGSVWEGYSPRRAIPADLAADLLPAIRSAYPNGHAPLDRELGRTLALLEDDAETTLLTTLTFLTEKSDPLDDIHYLIVLSRLRAARSNKITQQVAGALLALDAKITARKGNRDSNWPHRMIELHRELARKDKFLNDVLLTHADFGRPDHVVWTHADGLDRKAAARLFLARAKKDRTFTWNADLLALVSTLPDEEIRPTLLTLWDDAGLNEQILPLLARQPQPEDHERFLQGLTSPSLTTVRHCLTALDMLPPKKDGATLRILVQALRLLPEGKEEDKLRATLARLLQERTGATFDGSNPRTWEQWLAKAHPAEAAKLGGEDGVDMPAWEKRLAMVDWSRGDRERGYLVYTKASCAACHSASQALGPDLHGVAGRFSRNDLFTAMLRPSKDVPARYRATRLATAEGKTYQGLIIYEAVDSVLLQTGPADTVRLAHKQITEKRQVPTSLMPTGLLDRLKDEEIADLYAYLRGLTR